jgi:hypothetical protein
MISSFELNRNGGGHLQHIVDMLPEEHSAHYLNGNVPQKKQYSVTTDEARHRFITVWNSGTKTIKEVSRDI